MPKEKPSKKLEFKSQSEESPSINFPIRANDSSFQDEEIFRFFINWKDDEKDDIIGMVAFCIYKQYKVQFVEKYLTEHDRYPTEDEIHVFYNSYNESAFRDIINNAEMVLRRFQNDCIEKERFQLRKEMIQKVRF